MATLHNRTTDDATVNPRPAFVDIGYAAENGVATLILNRPAQLNALRPETGVELLAALRLAEQDETVRCVTLTGAGRAFCAGDDLRRSTPDGPALRGVDVPGRYVRGEGRWPQVVFAIRALPKPVLAVVNGYAYGAGFNLALACDFRLAAASASLATPFVKRGMATGANLLQQYVGIGVAARMTLFGEPVSAAEALDLGLVTWVVPDDRLAEEAARISASLASAATVALGLTKGALYRGWELDPERAYGLQGYAVHFSSATEDRAEGQRAFLEKREPVFQGR
jgi:2-(1,2-epoxy-1,2-dihydrophenyl)acetyl-CoA isomerase